MTVEVVVKEEVKNVRLDKYLAENTNYTRSKIEKMIDEGSILVNGKQEKTSFKVNEGDVLYVPDQVTTVARIKPEDINLNILYEDDYILVVDKPSGMVVHPGNGNMEHTLANALAGYTNKLSDSNGVMRPGIVHRIDKDTSGVLLVAKTDEVHNILAEGFKNKTIKRVYVALLDGVFPNSSATIDAPIGRDSKNRLAFTVTEQNAKQAVTHLKVIKRFEKNTLVELRLETGRTHQIRVHMKYIGFPVHNDPVYNNKKASKFGQFLHAKSLEFSHPITKETMYFESPLPSEFQEYLERLEDA